MHHTSSFCDTDRTSVAMCVCMAERQTTQVGEMKNNNASGEDNTTAELIQYRGKKLAEHF